MGNLPETETAGQTESPLSQRAIYRAVRLVVDFMADPISVIHHPVTARRANEALEYVFETCPRDSIFSPYIKHQLGEKKMRLLEQRYQDWTDEREAAGASA